ncbi:S8 family peptidase [Cognatilysobacter bugurensis]|uniref:Protease n=1 Tax=Cognatilysobacter bugurensis TaxID=543356 RepID=A0A918T2H4_9GAMM|nr:S8 family peptidase [Lysobacter bugurensis]GHA88042.1 protease [Lysobacter bugurensis]
MNRNDHFLRLTLLAATIATALAAPAAIAAPRSQPASNQTAASSEAGARLIVKYRDGKLSPSAKARTVDAAASRARALTPASAQSGRASPKARHMRTLGVGAELLKLDSRLSPTEMNALLRELKSDPAVAYVEVDRLWQHTGIAAPQLAPSDPGYATNQWHLQNTAGGMNATAGWDVSTGAGVVVAVLDTGIVPHADMNANMLEGYDFISDPFVSRRATNARVPGAYDYGDWTAAGECSATSTARNSSFHGTHVAGTVAEVSNNGIGVAGVAFNAKVLPVRVLGRCGGYTSDIADAIVWASGGAVPGVPTNTTPAEVINMSLGGGQACPSITQAAIDSAVSRGTTVVVAAGNSNSEVANFSPASCNNVISVAAGRVTGERAGYSNYGTLIDLTAPGGGGGVDGNPNGYVWQARNSSTTSPDLGTDTYSGFTGTSMAAPHVAGVAAMVQSVATTPKTPAQMEALLKQAVRPFPIAIPASTPIGTGLLDAKLALDAATAPPGTSVTPLTNKVRVTGISGAAGSSRMFSIEVPAGTSLLNVMTFGGTGNVGIYVKADAQPTTSDAGWRSVRPGNNETVRVSSPVPCTYYVLVHGTGDFSNVTLEARVD